MDFGRSAQELHNQARAFAPWPGTFADFLVEEAPPEGGGSSSGGSDAGPSGGSSSGSKLQLKILSTRVADASEIPADAAAARRVVWAKGGRMLVPCGGGGALEVLQLQQPAKKAVSARDLFNGLKGRQLYVDVDAASASASAAQLPAAKAAAGAASG
jgi:methionyl-tRNA formyltransferase